jgi:hypothetical protein
MSSVDTKVPSNFRVLVSDFTRDLSVTFPEYSHMWDKWGNEDTTDEQLETLFIFCSKVYPARFFDILYQNEEIFVEGSDQDVYFFPNMSFRLIFNSEGLSENSKKIIWKYLQLMLFTIVGSIDDKNEFGDTANLFAGIDENELQTKLNETMKNLTGFFENIPTPDSSTNEDEKQESNEGEKQESNEGEKQESNEGGDPFANMFKNMPNIKGMPDISNLQDTLKTLFDGKIGALAKEMAEDIADDFKDVLGNDIDKVTNPQDVIKQLMKNPAKISKLIKTVSSKLDTKMKDGSISKDEIMKEAGDMMSQMKQMGGMDNMKEMFETMSKSMGLGKSAKFDKNKMNQMLKREENRNKMKGRAEQRKEKDKKEKEEHFKKAMQQRRDQIALQQQYLSTTDDPNHMVFKLDGEDNQDKSFVHPDIEKMLEEEDAAKIVKEESKKNKKKKKKKKA